jgi:hypothetical protein
MTRNKDKTRPIRIFVVSIALSVAFWSVSASLERLSAQDRKASGTMYLSKRMVDGKQWMTRNLDVKTMPSYCYEGAEQNCRRYGRLYTWESATRACLSLGDGWRLPRDNEWRQMAKAYGGVSDDLFFGGLDIVRLRDRQLQPRQFCEGLSIPSITKTSTGAFCRSSLSPSCSCSAVIRVGALESGGGSGDQSSVKS